MEERYEIIEQIGHGGMGSVLRAFDRKMNRHVAIKRILIRKDDPAFREEATKQMMAEVGALSSLQHPHIVTIFDAGDDEEGPYVVMELLDGNTLDQIVERAPLTWEDFRIVAMQSLEALLAAHDLEMIHSDLKPPNIMLTWMPSGAFQVKIVDFGLATLIHNQSEEEIARMESVYGSVYFMPPEQFERKTLDSRSDLYSLGCCFYQALAGGYPFDGETVADVMQAHLDHATQPIHEIRSDVPAWACEWVMRMISRDPMARPSSARDALADFLDLDRKSRAAAIDKSTTHHPPHLITSNTPPLSASGPVPVSAAPPIDAEGAMETTNPPPSATGMFATAGSDTLAPTHGKTRRFPNPIWIAAPAATIMAILLITWLMKRNDQVRQRNEYNNIITMSSQPNVKQIHINAAQLQTIFDFMMSNPDADLTRAYQSMNKAKSIDGFDIDAAITRFATTPELPTSIRKNLFQQVVANRKHMDSVPILIRHAQSASTPAEAAAALDSVISIAGEEHADDLLGVIAKSNHQNVRMTAETRLAEIIARSPNRSALVERITQTRQETKKPSTEPHFERLLAASQPPTSPAVQAPSQPAAPTNAPSRP